MAFPTRGGGGGIGGRECPILVLAQGHPVLVLARQVEQGQGVPCSGPGEGWRAGVGVATLSWS